MSTRGVADVVFCIDASASMGPCFNALRQHIGKFVDGLRSNSKMTWDLRLEFIAHHASAHGGGSAHWHGSIHHDEMITPLYAGKGTFFTTDIEQFRSRLGRIEPKGDEATLIALDTALDLPFRSDDCCHRVIVLLTDEPLEDGQAVELQRARIADLIQKIHDLRVMLFIVAPTSDMFDELAAADRSQYQCVGGQNSGLDCVDFAKVLGAIGKSVSISNPQIASKRSEPKRALFGQDGWGSVNAEVTGR